MAICTLVSKFKDKLEAPIVQPIPRFNLVSQFLLRMPGFYLDFKLWEEFQPPHGLPIQPKHIKTKKVDSKGQIRDTLTPSSALGLAFACAISLSRAGFSNARTLSLAHLCLSQRLAQVHDGWLVHDGWTPA